MRCAPRSRPSSWRGARPRHAPRAPRRWWPISSDKYGASSERGRRLIDQLELELGELVTAASEDAAQAESAAGKDARGSRPDRPPRGQPVRAPLPAHLPRERVVIPGPTACPCCGGKLSKLGEDIAETVPSS
jgi:transposase